MTNNTHSKLAFENDIIEFALGYNKVLLSKGVHSINISVNSSKNNEPLLRTNSVLSFQVLNDKETWPTFLLDSNYLNQ